MTGLLVLGAAGWVGVLAWSHGMDNGPGPMGFGVVEFVAFWVVMMAAMMLPIVTTAGTRPAGLAATIVFAAGYLAVWTAVGVAFYLASLGTQRLAEHHHDTAVATGIAIFCLCAVYQCSAWKLRALRSCSAIQFPAITTIGAGAQYALRCLVTSIAMMLLFLALGFMQVAAMLVIALALFVERRTGARTVSVVLGAIALAYAIAIAVHPALAPGLDAAPVMSDAGDGM